MIEILCDVDMNGPTHHVISKTGNSLYRVCYEPHNLDETMLKLRHEGFLLTLVFEIWGDRHWFSRNRRWGNLNRGISDASWKQRMKSGFA